MDQLLWNEWLTFSIRHAFLSFTASSSRTRNQNYFCFLFLILTSISGFYWIPLFLIRFIFYTTYHLYYTPLDLSKQRSQSISWPFFPLSQKKIFRISIQEKKGWNLDARFLNLDGFFCYAAWDEIPCLVFWGRNQDK